MGEIRKRLIDKIALLDEQVGQETDHEKRKEIQEVLDENWRNLRYLNDEYDSQKQRWKRIWRDYLKKPDSLIPLKDRLKEVYKLEGFTIAFAIIAIAMIFTTIGLAISNSKNILTKNEQREKTLKNCVLQLPITKLSLS